METRVYYLPCGSLEQKQRAGHLLAKVLFHVSVYAYCKPLCTKIFGQTAKTKKEKAGKHFA